MIAVGYDPIEYEPRNWDPTASARVVVIDTKQAQLDNNFQPERELIGDIASTLTLLSPQLTGYSVPKNSRAFLDQVQIEVTTRDEPKPVKEGQVLNHPLNIVAAMQERIDDDMTVTADIGSFYIWLARHFRSYQPRHLLFTNGMQTLGVGLPWGIAAALVRPNSKVVSVSGDGGFLFSAQELETAVRLNLNIVHLVWNDGNYDMVKFQEELKYGHDAGVKFGPVDFAKYAESFGATGLRVEKAADLGKVLDKAFATQGPVVVDIPVDYSDNPELGKQLIQDNIN